MDIQQQLSILRELLRQQEDRKDKMLKKRKEVEDAYVKGLIPEVPKNFMDIQIPKMRDGGIIKLMPVIREPLPSTIPVEYMLKGGKIKSSGRPSKFELNNDTIPAILQVGEIVIPRNIATDKEFITKLEQFGYNKKKGIFT